MKYSEARRQMIQTWGQLSTQWGISRSMGQILALLMISPDPMTTDDFMEELGISRGSASMSLRSLLEWGVIRKAFVPGDRKEFYAAEKDAWKMAMQIARERKRRELDPLIQVLKDIQVTDREEATQAQTDEINRMAHQVLDVAMQVDKVLDIGIRSGGQSLVRKLINVLR